MISNSLEDLAHSIQAKRKCDLEHSLKMRKIPHEKFRSSSLKLKQSVKLSILSQAIKKKISNDQKLPWWKIRLKTFSTKILKAKFLISIMTHLLKIWGIKESKIPMGTL